MLEDVTDPNLIYNMRAKPDAMGYYDEPEIDRVAAAEPDPNSKQCELVRALEPVANRLTRRFKAAKQRWVEATEREDDQAAGEPHGETEAL